MRAHSGASASIPTQGLSSDVLASMRQGDVVLVRGTVAKPDRPNGSDRNVGVTFNHAGAGTTVHYVQASAIVSLERPQFEAGDRVTMANRTAGTVIAVGVERAFVLWDRAGEYSRNVCQEETATLLTHLERLP